MILVTAQNYEAHIFIETVILGNDAIFKCSVPSFISDLVDVINWIDSEGNELGSSSNFGN